MVGLVPTMGALHSGHEALLRAAQDQSDVVVVSVFVNPLQFNDAEDYRHYPRQLAQDMQLLRHSGADLIFAPGLEQMYPGYPDAPLVRVSTGDLGRRWEGAARPGHFDGVATVVTKLFSILTPPAPAQLHAWFGEKDAEQVAIVTRLTEDLNLPVQIRSIPIVRDDNGLALSSRNQRLSAADYREALGLSRALFTLRDWASSGKPLEIGELRAQLAVNEGMTLDYLVAVDPATLREVEAPGPLMGSDGVLQAEALGLIAARVGPVRLIDTMRLVPPTAH